MAATFQIHRQDIVAEQSETPFTTNFRTVASYNRLDEAEPAIMVLGSPLMWSPPQLIPLLPPDEQFRGPDEVSPINSLVAAVNAVDPAFPWKKYDVITDQWSLRKLLGFLRAETKKEYGPKTALRFILRSDDGLVSFIRVPDQTVQEEPQPAYLARPPPRQYRKSFEAVCLKTDESTKGSKSHHRILELKLLGLILLVNCRVNAYKPTETPALFKRPCEESQPGTEPPSRQGPVMNPESSPRTGVTVKSGGRLVEHESTLHFVTRSKNSTFQIQDMLPEYWISQTPKLFICRYEPQPGTSGNRRARFYDTEEVPLKEKLIEWEQGNEQILRKLGALLKQLVAVVSGSKRACIVSYSGEQQAPLVIEESSSGDETPTLQPSPAGLVSKSGGGIHGVAEEAPRELAE